MSSSSPEAATLPAAAPAPEKKNTSIGSSLSSLECSLEQLGSISSLSDDVFQEETRPKLDHDGELPLSGKHPAAKKQLFNGPFRLVAYSSSDDDCKPFKPSKKPCLTFTYGFTPFMKKNINPSRKTILMTERVCSHCGAKFANSFNRIRHENRLHKTDNLSNEIPTQKTKSVQTPSSPATTRSGRNKPKRL